MAGRTVLLVTADHGGKGKKHGGATMEEIEIPWILHGPGVAAGKEITAPVNTYDTAATVAHVFGLKPPVVLDRPARAGGVRSPALNCTRPADGPLSYRQ